VGRIEQRRTGAHADLGQLSQSIECHFRPLREFVVNASDYGSHADIAVAFTR
jgi:hypothetical protein